MSGFEEWWNNQCTNGYFIHHYNNDKELIEAAYHAGLDRAAEIADCWRGDDNISCSHRLDIASAIRAEKESTNDH